MSSLAEIQEAIEKLGPEERAELWTWFQEAEDTDELVAAVDEGILIEAGSCGDGGMFVSSFADPI